MENKNTKSLISESGENFKEAGKNLVYSVVNTSKGLYKAIDAGDKYLGSKIGTLKYKTLNGIKNNILKILIAGGSIIYSGDKIYEKISDHYRQEQEQEKNKTRPIKLNFSTIEKNIFWNRSVFFKKDLDQDIKNKQTIEKLDNGITLLHDAGLTFYLMTPEDIKNKDKTHSSRTNTIEFIRNKISKLTQFSYLSEDEYKPSNNVVTNSFNIRPDFKNLAKNSKLNKTPFWIPIPVKKDIREITNKCFNESGKVAIDVIGGYDKEYKYIRDKVEAEYSKENIAKLLTSIALVETGRTTSTIGTDTYHRRETGSHNCFSFGPSHILMEHGGIRSRKRLGVTEGQMYHPIISNMVILGFMVEKIKDKGIKNKDKISNKLVSMLNFIDKNYVKTTDKSLNKFSSFYNGSTYKKNNYNTKLSIALNNLSIQGNFLKNTDNFKFENLNTSGNHLIYSYKIREKRDTSVGETTNTIRKTFKAQYNCSSNNILICRKNGEAYSDSIIHQQGETIYIKLPISEALK